MVRLGHNVRSPQDSRSMRSAGILASVLSRALTVGPGIFCTIGGGWFLVLLHRFLAYLAFYAHGLDSGEGQARHHRVRGAMRFRGDAAQPRLYA